MRTKSGMLRRAVVISAAITIVAGTAVMGATPPSDLRFERSVASARSAIAATNAELRRLEPYVSTNLDGGQRLDTVAASASGTSRATLVLAADLVRYQNALRVKIRESHQDKVALDDYPAVREFFTMATAEAVRRMRQEGQVRLSSLDVAAVEPCGDYDHPVPAKAPSRENFGPTPSLESMGFHKTAGYACGADREYKCATDYTRGRDYKGPYGHCRSPLFRDQGQVVSGGKWIQFGEPNPELTTYTWPYWNWGSYVKWWHDSH
ncbi:MAG: hypothetical protein ACRDSZ_19095 [Pseudonocardiaceae bacterium]